MIQLGAEQLPSAQEKPEDVAFQYVEKMSYALGWHEEVWSRCELELQKGGVNWETLRNKETATPSSLGEILRIRDVVLNQLATNIESRKLQLQWNLLQSNIQNWVSYLDSFSSNEASYPVAMAMRTSIENRDYVAYSKAWQKLNELIRLKDLFQRRHALLNKLAGTAPGWSEAIRRRKEPHHQATLPGDAEMAWKISQWDQEITRRNRNDLDALQRDINSLKDQIQEVTAQYVERLAWNSQADRTSLLEQQALNGWLGIQRRIGAGTGKRVPILRAEARRLLKECRNAVPVWIMPLSRVIENFDLSKTRFDVVILDEASQSDILGLVSFAIAKEVVVVGDDEQVSPYAVGQNVMAVQSLINEYLADIPNRQLYDGKASVYDLARQSFGGTIRLVEHFRCVPDIIQFSNFLCYNGEIKALREANDTHLFPHLVAYRVPNGVSDNKVNTVEANVIASLILAASGLPEFEGCTIGVISLVGAEQAMVIDEILRRKMSVFEYQKRNVLCGNASQFQGDERDVMFLSVIDSSAGGPLAIRKGDEFRKTFNVAGSRARNQLWVVHSLNPDTDLKTGDLRLRLIKHAEDPTALRKQYESGERRTDSEFERLVLSHLTAASYRVICQWEVGAFSIDMVVLGHEERKVAIECDGDRYHPPDQLGKDLERQMILERLGWRFIRIRGSEFFRDQGRAIQRVIRRLRELGIEPIGPKPTDADENIGRDELKNRVIRRAEEIRRQWEEHPDTPAPQVNRKAHWRTLKKKGIAKGGSIATAEESEPRSKTEPTLGTQTLMQELPIQEVSPVRSQNENKASNPSDADILEHVYQILKEVKRPQMARELSDRLSKRGIIISKQALNQVLWNRNTRRDLKHDQQFRWSIE